MKKVLFTTSCFIFLLVINIKAQHNSQLVVKKDSVNTLKDSLFKKLKVPADFYTTYLAKVKKTNYHMPVIKTADPNKLSMPVYKDNDSTVKKNMPIKMVQ